MGPSENVLNTVQHPSFQPNWAIFGWRIELICDHIFSTGLDLTCSSSWGLNFDDFPFFWILYCTSRSRVMSNFRLIKNWEICALHSSLIKLSIQTRVLAPPFFAVFAHNKTCCIFYWLIISRIKCYIFPFFCSVIAPLEAELAMDKDW